MVTVTLPRRAPRFGSDALKMSLAAPELLNLFVFLSEGGGEPSCPKAGVSSGHPGPCAESKVSAPAPGERGSSSVLALLVSTPHSIPVTANLPPPTISCHLTALQSDSGRVTRPDRLLSGELVRQQPLPLISPR